MALRTPQQFKDSLRDGRQVYFEGQRVEDVTQHPAIRVGVESAAIDYLVAETPQYQEFAVVTDSE